MTETIKYRKMHAGFDGERQVTKWDTRRDKVHSTMRKCYGLRRNDQYRARKSRIDQLSIRTKTFIEKR